MDLILMAVSGGFALCVGRSEWWSPCKATVAIFPRAQRHMEEVLSALPHDDTETIQAPLSRVLDTVARLISTSGASEDDESGESPLVRPPLEWSIDLLIMWLPHCRAWRVGSGSGWEWRGRANLVAVFPKLGWCQTDVQNALSRNEWSSIQAPLSCVLAVVAQFISTHRAIEASYLDDSGTEEDTGTVCSCCRRAREASPPPAPQPADPNVPRLTEEALAQHTREHERDRSRSPARAASPSAEASR
jgi:hypothetical protein